MQPLCSEDKQAQRGPESGLPSTKTSARVLFSFRARSELARCEHAMDALQAGDRTPRSQAPEMASVKAALALCREEAEGLIFVQL